MHTNPLTYYAQNRSKLLKRNIRTGSDSINYGSEIIYCNAGLISMTQIVKGKTSFDKKMKIDKSILLRYS